MADSSIASRFAARPGLSALGAAADDEACDNLGCFGWLRGTRERAVMLELRKKNGSILAVNYSWLERLEFDPSEGITLHTAGQAIRIKGKHLNGAPATHAKLFEGLTRHCVPWVQEAALADKFDLGSATCVVESIDWERK